MMGDISPALAGVVGVVLTAVIGWLSTRRATSATAVNQVSEAATSWAREAVTMFERDNARLRMQVEGLITRVEELTTEVHQLRDRVGDLTTENLQLLRRLAEWDPTAYGGSGK